MEQSMLDIKEAERKLILDELKLERELARERCGFFFPLSPLCSCLGSSHWSVPVSRLHPRRTPNQCER
jgi:hypothetical protein